MQYPTASHHASPAAKHSSVLYIRQHYMWVLTQVVLGIRYALKACMPAHRDIHLCPRYRQRRVTWQGMRMHVQQLSRYATRQIIIILWTSPVPAGSLQKGVSLGYGLWLPGALHAAAEPRMRPACERVCMHISVQHFLSRLGMT